jgi:uncharacterized membrane protein
MIKARCLSIGLFILKIRKETTLKNKTQKLNFNQALPILVRFILMLPFNVFIIFVPGFLFLALIISLWALVFALIGGGPALIVTAFQTGLMALSFWLSTSLFSISLFALCFSVVLGFTMVFLTKHFVLFVVNYLQWNFHFIRGR